MPRGNNRLDSFENIVATGQVGLLFLIPGFDETLRVNGRATLSLDLADIAACSNERRAPKAGEGGMLGTAALQAKFVRQQIHRVRELTDKPFGVNLVLSLLRRGQFEACLVERVPFLVLFWGDPSAYLGPAQAQGIIEGRPAACVQITPIESVYVWQGEVQQAGEFRLLFKTTSQAHAALVRLIAALHPYDLPAVLGLSIFRLVQVPRDLLAGRRRIPRRSAALVLGIVWSALACHTGLILYTAAKAIASPPTTPAPAGAQVTRPFEERLAANPALYGRVKLGTLPTPPGYDRRAAIAPPGGSDAVLTFRNIHNWLEAGHLDESLRTFARALKPGGLFGVEEHRAAPGTPLAQMKTSDYVTEDLVIGESDRYTRRYVKAG